MTPDPFPQHNQARGYFCARFLLERRILMEPRILIAYATWTGATHEVADAIAAEYVHRGLVADVRPANEVKDLAGYDAVILGTGVHAGKLPGPILHFVQENAAVLSNMPVALFLLCLTMSEDTPENRATALEYLAPLRAKAPQMVPVDIGLFGGAVLTEGKDFDRQDIFRKMMERSMAKTAADARNWDSIGAWAGRVAPLLVGAQA